MISLPLYLILSSLYTIMFSNGWDSYLLVKSVEQLCIKIKQMGFCLFRLISWRSKPTSAVLCPWARHFTPRKYWLKTQEAVAPSRHDWKIVDWDVKPQHKQTNHFLAVNYSFLPVDEWQGNAQLQLTKQTNPWAWNCSFNYLQLDNFWKQNVDTS